MSNDKKADKTPKDTHYANLRRAHRDARSDAADAAPAVPPAPAVARRRGAAPDGLVRLYGLHTVRAALDNPERKITKHAGDAQRAGAAGDRPISPPCPSRSRSSSRRTSTRSPARDAVHQGVADRSPAADAEARSTRSATAPLVLVLDQVTDPHNVGAIMRSAVAFGAGALITTARHSPQESGVLAKSASGALEHIDLIEVNNLADALGELHEAGFQTIGLDSDGPAELETVFRRRKDRAGARRRGQGPAAEDARDRDRARPPRHARRDPLAQRVECGGGGLYAARRFLTQRPNRRPWTETRCRRPARFGPTHCFVLLHFVFASATKLRTSIHPPRGRPSAPAP